MTVRAIKSESSWSNKAENAVRRVKELHGCIQKEFEARTRAKVRILDQLGKLMMRHVEYIVNHVQRREQMDLDGSTAKVTIFERYH